MLDGSTPALSSLLLISFYQLIVIVECFGFVHVDKICLKSYSWTVIHTTSPHKHVFVYLMFHHFLLVEVSHYFYIKLLIVLFVFSQRCLFRIARNAKKVGLILISIKLKTLCQYFLNPKMEITTINDILLFRLMLYAIVYIFGST